MTGIVQGLLASYATSSSPPPASGKTCTSGDVAIGCCKAAGVCAPDGIGSGATCSPIAAEGLATWDYNC